VTPDQLRNEAGAAEAQAKRFGPGPDRDWLTAKAETLRRAAERLEHRLDARADLLRPRRRPMASR
jgi:hypothetical protein